MTEKVSKDKFKVLISGVGADEIFSGYYDHTLQFLYEIRNLDLFKKELKYWKKIFKIILEILCLKITSYILKIINLEIICMIFIKKKSFFKRQKKI